MIDQLKHRAPVLKLGVATFLRVTKFVERVAKLKKKIFCIMWPKIRAFYKVFYIKQGGKILLEQEILK